MAFYAKNVYTSLDIPSKLSTTQDGFIVYADDETNEYYLINYVGNETKITLPESINGNNYEIYQYTFFDCSSLESITIPDSVTSIGEYAFSGSYSWLDVVYYGGTESDWAEISIGRYNDGLTAATRYYYSESQPTEEGNFWHYAEDGVTPVIWTKETAES